MSNIDTSKVYLFLSKNKNWQTEADTSGDGRIIKSEFRAYMEQNYNWNGEESSDKSDLINAFWKEIDTNQSGRFSKKLNNKGTLDDSELNSMNNKIEKYEYVNDFVENQISAPEGLDSKTWKAKVAESLSNTVQKNFLNSNISMDDFKKEIIAYANVAQNKATADMFALNFLNNNSELKNIAKDYYGDYANNENNDLRTLIDSYIKSLSGEESVDDIKTNVQEIVNNFLATVGIGDGDPSKLGYTENSPLNDLQKSIVKTNVMNGLADIKNESDYEKYQSLYDEAVNSYLDNLLTNSTFKDYETIQGYGMPEFKESDAYKSVKKAIEVSAYMDSDEFKSALSSQISSSLSDVIFKGMSDERPEAYNTLVAEAMEKAKNGEFDDAYGNLDQEKFKKYIIDNIKSNLDKYYENGFGDMSLEDLGTLYDKLVEAAKASDNSSAVKTAAISYCQAVSKKSTALAQAVKDVFGSDYASKINSLKSYEIDSKMTDLKSKVEEIGDISLMKDYEKNSLLSNIKTSYDLMLDEVQTMQLPTSATCNGKTITTDRISYSASGAVSVDKNTGKVTIDSSKAGTYSGSVSIYIDGELITSKTITVNVKNSYSAAALVKNVTGWTSAPDNINVLREGNRNNLGEKISSADFSELYNNDNIIVLTYRRKDNNYNWCNSGAAEVRERLVSLGTSIVETLASANSNLDKTKLQQAANIVVNKYAVNPKGDYFTHTGKDGKWALEECYNHMTQNKDKVKYGLVQSQHDKGDNTNVYAIYFKEFVDAIITEYNKLVA